MRNWFRVVALSCMVLPTNGLVVRPRVLRAAMFSDCWQPTTDHQRAEGHELLSLNCCGTVRHANATGMRAIPSPCSEQLRGKACRADDDSGCVREMSAMRRIDYVMLGSCLLLVQAVRSTGIELASPRFAYLREATHASVSVHAASFERAQQFGWKAGQWRILKRTDQGILALSSRQTS